MTSLAGVTIRAASLLITMLVLAIALAPAAGQTSTQFPDLQPGVRVYDETGTSLSPEQIASLEEQLADLQAISANTVIYVRALDATPEETLEQVEALQGEWAQVTGGELRAAIAILINRNPDDPTDARAGIWVGRHFRDGNVPESEQRAIVDDELIPPLRYGDVYGSLSGALDRLESSILSGPPRSKFEKWADEVSDSWLLPVGLILALLCGAGMYLFHRTRQVLSQPPLPPTTVRPGDLSPALAGALVSGGPQASAIPATLLSMAERGVVGLEPESDGGFLGRPKLHVRLLDSSLIQDEVESVLWEELCEEAEDGVVTSKGLRKIATDIFPLRRVLVRQIREAGWEDPNASTWKILIGLLTVVSLALGVCSFGLTAVGENWLSVISAIALFGVAIAGITMYSTYSNFTPAGQEAARPWLAYREGLKAAIEDEGVTLDLDRTLPDAIAMNLGTSVDDRVEGYLERGNTLRAFRSTVVPFPYWAAFHSSVTTAGSSSTVSGSSSSGGGAAGST